MNSPLISIIVPVYNTENYLARCINSILAQTYTNLELILIDDGSNDRSGDICDEFKTKDCRIKVLHQPNQGVAATRQKGMDIATGDYLIQFDSDDWVDKTIIETLLNTAILHNADMVICDMMLHFQNYTQYCSQSLPNFSAEYVLKRLVNQTYQSSLANKLIRRKLLTEYRIRLSPQLMLGEDLFICCALLKHHIKICYVPQALYHYQIIDRNNVCNKKTEQALHSIKTLIEELESFVDPTISNNFYSLKKSYLRYAFVSGLYDKLKYYPEVHNQIIFNSKYNPLAPEDYCTSLAIQGKVQFAKRLFFLSHILIKVKNYIQITFKLKRKL